MKRALIVSLAAMWLATTAPAGAQPDRPYHTYDHEDCAADPASLPSSCEAEASAHPVGSARLHMRVDAGPAHAGTGLGVVPAKAHAFGTAAILSHEDIADARDEVTVRVTLYVNDAGIMLGGNLPRTGVGTGVGTGGYADLSLVLTHTACGTCLGSVSTLIASSYEDATAQLGEITLEATMTNYGDPIPPGRVFIEISAVAGASLGYGSLLGDTGTAQTSLEFRVVEINVD